MNSQKKDGEENVKKVCDAISPSAGYLGTIHEHKFESPDSLLVMQLPRETRMLSDQYVKAAIEQARKAIGTDRNILVIGCDVNIYELSGADATALKLKGLI